MTPPNGNGHDQGVCAEHSGFATKMNLAIWLLTGNGALLLVIVGFMLNINTSIGANMNKTLELERRTQSLEDLVKDLNKQLMEIRYAQSKPSAQ